MKRLLTGWKATAGVVLCGSRPAPPHTITETMRTCTAFNFETWEDSDVA